MRERKNRICARSRGRIFERSHHRQHHEAEHHLARLRLVLGHQRRGRMGRRVPVSSNGVPNHRDRVLVLPRAIARVLVQLLRQRPGIVLLPRPHAHIHRTAGHHALPFGMVLPHRGHLSGRMGAAARRRRRRAPGPGVGRFLHAVATPVRQPGFRHRQPRPHQGHPIRGGAVLLAVPYSASGDGVSHPARVPAAIRVDHCAEKPRDRPRSSHVPGRAARPSARVPAPGERLLAKRAMRGRAGVLHGHHALPGHRRAGGGIARERAVDGRIVDRGYIAAGVVAVQEPQRERGGRLPSSSRSSSPRFCCCRFCPRSTRAGWPAACTPCTAWLSCS